MTFQKNQKPWNKGKKGCFSQSSIDKIKNKDCENICLNKIKGELR